MKIELKKSQKSKIPIKIIDAKMLIIKYSCFHVKQIFVSGKTNYRVHLKLNIKKNSRNMKIELKKSQKSKIPIKIIAVKMLILKYSCFHEKQIFISGKTNYHVQSKLNIEKRTCHNFHPFKLFDI